MALLFWSPISVVSYTYVVYPVIVCLVSHIRRAATGDSSFLPSVSILIALYDEEEHLLDKTANFASLDQLPDRPR
jgi:hypothetical protein